MKCVAWKDEVWMFSDPFKEELESGEYYEIPDDLMREWQDAKWILDEAEAKIHDYMDNHPMVSEAEDIEVAPTVPILPPGVDK